MMMTKWTTGQLVTRPWSQVSFTHAQLILSCIHLHCLENHIVYSECSVLLVGETHSCQSVNCSTVPPWGAKALARKQSLPEKHSFVV
jgi:hypothetical protein